MSNASGEGTSSGQGPWRTYEVYQPAIERHFVVDVDNQPLQYNHDSSVAWFKDRWICLWNAHIEPNEGVPGQLNYMATSRDGKTWTAPVACFADPQYSENPIPCPSGTQWQPNLIEVEGQLWAVWYQNSNDRYGGCYVSRLSAPDGKWANELLMWDGQAEVRCEFCGQEGCGCGKGFRYFCMP